jgi:hypothetical protein
MADRILAEQTLLTTADAGRLLQVTRFGVHHLARTGQLKHRRTLSGQWLFEYGVVMQMVAQRAKARLQRRGERLAAVRVRMLKAMASGEARQLGLFQKRHLSERSLHTCAVKRPTLVRKSA